MSATVPLCTHVKTNGIVCGSPAMAGTALCYHHSVVKTTLDRVPAGSRAGNGDFEPIPFVFPEDRAGMQINFFLLLEAFNQHRIDLRTYRAMLGLLKAMARNLGKSGSLVETKDQENSEPTSQKRDASASSGQAAGHPQQARGNSDQNGEDEDASESLVMSAAAAEAENMADAGIFETAPDYGCLPSFKMSPVSVGLTARRAGRMARR